MIYVNGYKLIEDSDWAKTNVGTNLFAISKIQTKYISQIDGSQVGSLQDISLIVPTNGATSFVFSAFDTPYTYNGINRAVFFDKNKAFSSWKPLVSGINQITDSNTSFVGLSINIYTQGGVNGKQMEWLKHNRYKLELGTIATQWSPAPEDLVTQSDLDDLKAQIEQLKSK